MAYTFENALVLPEGIGQKWVEKDISQEIVKTLYTKYKGVYLILSNNYITGLVYVNIADIYDLAQNYPYRVVDFLDGIGNATLPTRASLPSTSVDYVTYMDARYAMYKIDIARAGFHDPADYPPAAMQDLAVTRPDYRTQISLLHTKCLLTVDGYHHLTATDGNTTWVIDGADTMRIANEANMGIWDFTKVGELQKLPIKDLEYYPSIDTGRYQDRIVIEAPTSLEGKSVLLVLGGYLILPQQNVFWITGDKTVALDLKGIPYIERIHESQKYIDLSTLDLTALPGTTDTYGVDQLLSNETIEAYLKISQSFMVIVDRPQLVWGRMYMRNWNVPGQYTSYYEPTYPLIAGYGRAPEYWVQTYKDYWEIRALSTFRMSYIFETIEERLINYNSGNPTPARRHTPSKGMLLEIGGYDLQD